MLKTGNPIHGKSYELALAVVMQAKYLFSNGEYVLSKQFLRSGTSVGANVREALNAQSKPDFIHKMYISQKECAELIYWIELLNDLEYLDDESFNSLFKRADEVYRILKSIIISSKKTVHNS